MKHMHHILAVIVTFALFGCGRSGSQGTAGFEGTYVETDNPDILRKLIGRRLDVVEFKEITPSLETVYLRAVAGSADSNGGDK